MAQRKSPERPDQASEGAAETGGLKKALGKLNVSRGVRALAEAAVMRSDTIPPGFSSRLAYQAMKQELLELLDSGNSAIRREIHMEFAKKEHGPRGHVLMKIAEERGIKPLPKADLDKLMHWGMVDSRTGRPISERPEPMENPRSPSTPRPSRRPISENPVIARAHEISERRQKYFDSLPPAQAEAERKRFPTGIPPGAFTKEEREEARRQLESRLRRNLSTPPPPSGPRPSPRPPHRPAIHPPARRPKIDKK